MWQGQGNAHTSALAGRFSESMSGEAGFVRLDSPRSTEGDAKVCVVRDVVDQLCVRSEE